MKLMERLATNIPDHILEINEDIIKSLTAVDNGDYYTFGKYLAEALVTAIGTDPVTYT